MNSLPQHWKKQKRMIGYQFIQKYATNFSIKIICKMLNISRAAYYNWTKNFDKNINNEYEPLLTKYVKKIFENSKQNYGRKRIKISLIKENIHISEFKTKTCVQIAVNENFNLFAQITNIKSLKRKWVEENLTNNLIAENSTLATDMQVLYDIVALQKSQLQQFKLTTNKQRTYQNLKNVSKAQYNLKEFLTHYHGIGFTNIQDYLNLWKWKYQHYGLNAYQQSNLLYFNL